jgi:hypothetical protein
MRGTMGDSIERLVRALVVVAVNEVIELGLLLQEHRCVFGGVSTLRGNLEKLPNELRGGVATKIGLWRRAILVCGVTLSGPKLITHEPLEVNDGISWRRRASESIATSREHVNTGPLLVIGHPRYSKRQSTSNRQRAVSFNNGIGNGLEPVFAVISHPGLGALPVHVAMRLIGAKKGLYGHGVGRPLARRRYPCATR